MPPFDEAKINDLANEIIKLGEKSGLSFNEVQRAIFKAQELVQIRINDKLSDPFSGVK